MWFINGVLWSPGYIFDLNKVVVFFKCNCSEELSKIVLSCETIERHSVLNLKLMKFKSNYVHTGYEKNFSGRFPLTYLNITYK